MSETKKTISNFILKITYDKETLKIQDIQEIHLSDEEREYLVCCPNAIDERLVKAFTVEDKEELSDCFDFVVN